MVVDDSQMDYDAGDRCFESNAERLAIGATVPLGFISLALGVGALLGEWAYTAHTTASCFIVSGTLVVGWHALAWERARSRVDAYAE